VAIVGVFDGHGGAETAEYISIHLPINLLRDESFEEDMPDALRESFFITNDRYFDYSSREAISDNMGSTAVLAVLKGNELWVAWTGDSEAALIRSNGITLKCCAPHKPWVEEEKRRIEEKGGFVQERGNIMRVCGNLAVSRAFGYPSFHTKKRKKERKKKEPIIRSLTNKSKSQQ